MVEWPDMVPDILSEANGCPDMVLERHLRNAAIEFFHDSEVWTDTVTVPPSDGELVLTPPAGTSISSLGTVTAGRRVLRGLSPSQFAIGRKSSSYTFEGATLKISKDLIGQEDLIATVNLKPSRKSEGVPEIYYDEWFEVIQHGALMRTLLMSGSPWYEPNRATYYAEQYRLGLERAIRKGKYGANKRVMTTRFSW